MTPTPQTRAAALILAIALTAAGCSSHKGVLEPVPADTNPVVFQDAFVAGMDYQAFLGSKLDALALDTAVKRSGTKSLRFTVPDAGDPSGGYAGGAFITSRLRDFSGYNALTFWAKASRNMTLDVAGLGNDNSGRSLYTASRTNFAVTTAWQQFVIPIPLPARLAHEGGLFFLAEGPENGVGGTLWIDDVQFEVLPGISNPRPSFPPQTIALDLGSTLDIPGARVTFAVDGTDVGVDMSSRYLDFASSDSSIAAVRGGQVLAVGLGTATVTGRLGFTPAIGTVTVTTKPAPTGPPTPPTLPAADVLSLFSGVYANLPVDRWSADWDLANVSDVSFAGDVAKRYAMQGDPLSAYAGIEFTSHPVDATPMTHLHADFWVAPVDPTLGTPDYIKVKLVDFGANGVFGGGDDSESLVFLSSVFAGTSRALTPGQWSSVDIPLGEFTSLAGRAHLAQIVLESHSSIVYLDNLYLHK
jgi:hypothetical protein